MKRSLRGLVLVSVGALVFAAQSGCGGDNNDDPKVDASSTLPPGPDASSLADTGPGKGDTGADSPDVGVKEIPDGSVVTLSDAGGYLVTIPVMNNRDSLGHEVFAEYPNNRVSFKGIVVSPVFRYSMSTSNADPKKWYCRMGVYMIDPTAAAPEYNGIVLLSDSTVTANPNADGGFSSGGCAKDSVLEKLGTLNEGDELEVSGFFKEDCWRTDKIKCDDRDQNGLEIAKPVVEANMEGSIVKTGQNIAIPANLPVKVRIEDIASGGSKSAITVGPKFWEYRSVLVKVEKAVVTDDTLVSCNYKIQDESLTGPQIIINDDVNYLSSCGARFAKDSKVQELTGISTWYSNASQAEAQISPRKPADVVATLPVGLDAGMAGDVGIVQTTIPVINDQEAAGHAAFATYPNNKINFKGVVVTPIYRVSKTTSGTDPKMWNCKMGVYLADPALGTPEHNGVLLTSESSVLVNPTGYDGGVGTAGECAKDSVLEQLQVAADGGVSPLVVGDEIEVTGFYKEDCFRQNHDAGAFYCVDRDQSGKEISVPVVEANVPGSLVRTGLNVQPTGLPAVVQVEEINSTGTKSAITLGSKWWDYRSVLVKVENVKVTNNTLLSCNFKVAPQSPDAGIAPELVVNDDVMFISSQCPARPAADTLLQSLTGISTRFSNSSSFEAQLAPRSTADIKQ